MAINYTNLFENIGEYVDRVNEYATVISTLGTGLAEVEAELVGNNAYGILEGEFTRITRYRETVLGWINDSKSKILELWLDKETIRDELGLGDVNDFPIVFAAFYDAMSGATESVTANSVTLGSVTASTYNTTSATVYVSKVLDGVNAPHTDYPVVVNYDGINSQLALSDAMTLTVVTDNETDGITEGQETLQWNGRPQSGNNYSWLTYGSGTGPTISPIQSGTLMSNLEFQDFTSNAPDSWTIDAGSAGTQIDDDVANVHRGDTSLKLTGNASIASIQISQDAPTLTPRKRYMVGFYVKGNASISAGTLTIQFEGTGYTAASSEKISLNAAALAAITTFQWQYFWINMPQEIPSDFELVIKWNGTPSAHSLYINGGGFKEATYFNGHCAMAVAGQEPLIRGDTFTYTVTNDYAGVFQTAFAKLLGVQVPSSGSPTQADSLAT